MGVAKKPCSPSWIAEQNFLVYLGHQWNTMQLENQRKLFFYNLGHSGINGPGLKGLWCVHKNMINRQRDTIFAPNIYVKNGGETVNLKKN